MKIFINRHWFHPSHGPQVWPWWRWLSVSVVNSTVHPPSWGNNIWFYTRWGAFCVEIYEDNR